MITETCNGIKREIHYEDENGDADFVIYKVFDGIDLVFSSIHTDNCILRPTRKCDMLEISHCREGRMEMIFDEDYFYLSAGDLSVSRRENIALCANFPLKHYHGIALEIEADFVPKAFTTMLKETPVNPADVVNYLCGDENYYISRSEEYVKHIFSELYTVPEEIRLGYFRVKILELLLMLSIIEPEKTEKISCLSANQVQLAKQIHDYLHDRMHKRPTISELSEHFGVSETQIKTAFKGVYGVPVYSFMKIQKMHAAALQLTNTDRSVLEIAMDYGYNSGSKFSAVFREVMGELPLEYRKVHKRKNIIKML